MRGGKKGRRHISSGRCLPGMRRTGPSRGKRLRPGPYSNFPKGSFSGDAGMFHEQKPWLKKRWPALVIGGMVLLALLYSLLAVVGVGRNFNLLATENRR